MSLSIIDQPSENIESAYSQIVYGLQSDRDSSLVATITAVAANFTKAEFSAGLHAYKSGDVVTLSGFTETTYNGDFNILETSAGTITCDVTFVSNDSGDAALKNANFAVSSKMGLLGVNTVYDISAIETGTPPAVGENIGRSIRTNIPIDEVEEGDLINVLAAASGDVKRVWEVASVSVDSGDTVLLIAINLDDTVVDSAGTIEVLGKISGGFPEKFSDGIMIGSNERYRFNLSNILQTILLGDLAPLGTANIVDALLGIQDVGIVFTEFHDDVDGFREAYESESVNDVEYVDNIFQHTDTKDITDYILDNPTTGLFLTNSPEQDIRVGEEVQLSFLSPNETGIELRYETFDLAGASNGEASLGAVVLTSNKAIATINANIITSAISRVDVWIVRTSDAAQFSEKKTLNVLTNCVEPVRFWFRNPRGGYDQYTSTGDRETIKRTSYDTITKPLPFEFATQDRGEAVGRTVSSFELSAFTDFLKEEQRDWLGDLFDSNDVYVEEGGELVPVMVRKGNVLIDSNQLISFQIKYAFANQQITKI